MLFFRCSRVKRGNTGEAFMDQPQFVLDYASPRPRVKLRLAANSVLHHKMIGGRYVITEILSGKGQAIGAMLFCAFVLMTMVLPLFGENTLDRKTAAGSLLFFGTIMTGLSLLIIRNTWRRTILSADSQAIEVIFTGPLSSTRRYASPAMSIEKIEVVQTDVSGTLGELRVAPLAGAELHLFTDHPFVDVKRLADSISRALAGTARVGVTVIPTAEMAARPPGMN
jgi:hypothetical protein